MNLPNIKKCKKCGKMFDFYVCPNCRRRKQKDEVEKFIDELELDDEVKN